MRFVQQNFHFANLSWKLSLKVPLDSNFLESENPFLFLDPKLLKKKCLQICSTMIFAEQNFLFPTLRWNFYERFPQVSDLQVHEYLSHFVPGPQITQQKCPQI
jgi:hypothetical protein